MKRLLATTALLLALPIFLSQPVRAMPVAGSASVQAQSSNSGAQKVDVYRPAGQFCQLQWPDGEEVGFAIMHLTMHGAPGSDVNGEVSLKEGLPDTTYTVFLLQGENNCMMVATLETNGQGNGNAHFKTVSTGGYAQLFLMACFPQPDKLVSEPVSFFD